MNHIYPFSGGHDFDAPMAASKRDSAMAAVEGNTPDETKAIFTAAIRTTAETKEFFTTDDAVKLIPEELLLQTECRVLGPLMRNLQKEGVAEPTMSFRKSDKVSCNCRPKRVWHSLIYRRSES